MLRGCAEALVTHLGGSRACLWTLDEEENVLELRADSGGGDENPPHARVSLGHLLIGRIAQERRAQSTDAVAG